MADEDDDLKKAVEQCESKGSRFAVKACIEKIKRQYKFSKLFIEEIKLLKGEATDTHRPSFTIRHSTKLDVFYIYVDYEGYGLMSIGIPIGNLNSLEYDEIGEDDWVFESLEAQNQLGIDINTTKSKTQLTGCINRAMFKARR
jgi:hypothetical protein